MNLILPWVPFIGLAMALIAVTIGVMVGAKLRQANQRIQKLEQRLHASEQMQSVLSRSYRGISQSLNRSKSQNDGEDARYQRAAQMIANGATPSDLSKTLDIPVEEAELMAQIQGVKHRA